MAVIEKDIIYWERIMLDTSVILSLFHSESEDCEDETVLFIRKLVDYLEESQTGDKRQRVFLISTIAISEVLTKENDQEKIKKILRTINSSNVEFVDFDLDASLMFNYHLYPHLSNKVLNEHASSFGFKSHEYVMAREWITRDFMIIMSGLRHNADVILTADKKTFYPLSDKANAFCALSYPNYFNHSEKFIVKYHHADARKENLLEEAIEETESLTNDAKKVEEQSPDEISKNEMVEKEEQKIAPIESEIVNIEDNEEE